MKHPKFGWRAGALAWLVALLTACGGGAQSDPSALRANAQDSPAAMAATSGSGGGMPAPDPGLLLMLVPDSVASTDPRIAEWVDAAIEIGVRLTAVNDTQFLALSPSQVLQYGGLVLPDDLHSIASDTLIDAVKAYANQGGRVMLTFDFGALTTTASGVPVYPIPKSRWSDFAGVDYVLYEELRERTTGLGPITGIRSALKMVLVPPGKSIPYTTGSGSGAAAKASIAAARPPKPTETNGTRYLPVTVKDPGGVRGFDPQQFQDVRLPNVQELHGLGQLRRQTSINWGASIVSAPVKGVTRAQERDAAALRNPGGKGGGKATVLATAIPDTLNAYSGYLYGYLTYPSYVTRGDYAGLAIATSPEHGLVAGVKAYGAGQVLFVNLPLTYLKGRTDALPMHGFLNYFAHQMGNAAYVSPMPNGVPGLTLNWHLDSNAAQQPSLDLEQLGVFNGNAFSMHITAGPDAILPGDGLGWNLNNNPVAQALLRRLDAAGQDVGSHGGWIHDYYGLNANETNQTEFQPLLRKNRQSVEGVLGKASRSYSAPEGNNPTWAMDWLAARGVVGAYYLGHTGLGATRQYRNGALMNPQMFVFPVTPQGMYATYEEFQAFGVTKQEVIDWYHDLVDFCMENDTSRMVYAHPPGAALWPDVLQDLIAYVNSKGPTNLRWYNMPTLSDHLLRRQNVAWTQAVQSDGSTRFDAVRMAGLGGLVWRLPKTRYQQPVILFGPATVEDGSANWLVRTVNSQTLAFKAQPV